MSWHCEAEHSFRPLETRYAFRGGADGGGITIVSNKMGSRWRSGRTPLLLNNPCWERIL